MLAPRRPASTTRFNRGFFRRDGAEVGVGTLIVFIAMVLVAAVAAAVLINTTGSLQQRAQATGKEATQEVASNLRVTSIYGVRNSTSTDLYDLKMQVNLAAGATQIDLTKLIIRYSDGQSVRNYNHSTASLGDGALGSPQTWFNATWLRGSGANFVMESGDLVELHFNLYGSYLAERQEVEIMLIPEVGASVPADFRSPATYGTDLTITLR